MFEEAIEKKGDMVRFRCYVDPCNCNAADISQTDYFSTTANGMPLYYSYQSCGPVADYTVGQCEAMFFQFRVTRTDFSKFFLFLLSNCSSNFSKLIY